MKEELKKLLEIQELDHQIDVLNDKKISLPKKLEEFKNKIKEENDEVENLKKQLQNSQKNRKMQEVELESKTSEIKKLQVQLYEVKTNEQYSAIQREIENIKESNGKLEEEILMDMEKEDGMRKKIEEQKKVVKEKEDVLNKVKEEYDEELKKVEEQLGDKNNQRAGHTGKVSKDTISLYEKIRSNKGGTGIAKINDSICGGCYMNIRPQLLIELNKNEEPVLCESCSRILYSD